MKWLDLEDFGCKLFIIKNELEENKGIALEVLNEDLFNSFSKESELNIFFHQKAENKPFYISSKKTFDLQSIKKIIPKVSLKNVIDLDEAPYVNESEIKEQDKFDPDSFSFAFSKKRPVTSIANSIEIEIKNESKNKEELNTTQNLIHDNSNNHISIEFEEISIEFEERTISNKLIDYILTPKVENSPYSINFKNSRDILKNQNENASSNSFTNKNIQNETTVNISFKEETKKEEERRDKVKLDVIKNEKEKEILNKRRKEIRFDKFATDNSTLITYKSEKIDPFNIYFSKNVINILSKTKNIMLDNDYANIGIIEKTVIDETTKKIVIKRLEYFFGQHIHLPYVEFKRKWDEEVKKGVILEINKIIKTDFENANFYYILHNMVLNNNQYQKIVNYSEKYLKGYYDDINLNLWVEFGLIKD